MRMFKVLVVIGLVLCATNAWATPSSEFVPDADTVALWHLNGNGSDASGNGNNLAVKTDRVSWVAGKFDQGAEMGEDPWSGGCWNSDGGALTAPGAGCTYPGSGDWTVEAWVCFPSNSETYYAVIHYSEHWACHEPYHLGVSNGEAFFVIQQSCNEYDHLTADISEYMGQWVHIAGVYRYQQDVSLYVNGVRVTYEETTLVPENLPNYNVFLGGCYCGTSTGLKVDEVRISDVARYTGSGEPPEGCTLCPWELHGPESDMVIGVHGFGAAALDGYLYAVGGQSSTSSYGTNHVQRYCLETGTWEMLAPLPTARHSLDCAVVDGYIYAIGGHVYNSRSENQRYDPSTNTWTSMASKPTAVSGPGIATFDSKIYTFGGNRYGSKQSVIEVYDPGTNSWQQVGHMPAAGEPWRAATLGNKIYLAGGGFQGEATDHLWAYDPVANTWDTSLPTLNIPRTAHELVVVGDCLFVIGGSPGYLNSVEWWKPGEPSWTLAESLNGPRGHLGAEAIGNTIYTFGGYDGQGSNLSSMESVTPCEPEPPCDNSLAIVYDRDGDIYVANTDGSNETQLTNESNSDIMPSISPDGSTIAFSRGSDLYLMDYDGTNQRPLVSKSAISNNNVHNSDWTLDGEWIYFSAVSGCCSGGLYKVRQDGSGLTLVKSGYVSAGLDIRGTFGDKVIFNQRRSGLSYSQNVRITDLDGGNEEHVTGGGPSESSATFGTCWSPDGQRFAYNYGHQHIMVASYPAPYNPIEVKTFGSWKSHSLEWLNNDTLIWIDASDSGPMHTINVDTLVEGDLGIDGHYPYVGQICAPAVAVAVDIKPGSCPNPLNLKSKGVLPVAILGSEDFDVSTIDAVSVRLAGIAPIRHNYEDVGTPVTDGDECACTEEGPDGYIDLTVKFRTQEIVEELVKSEGELVKHQVLVLSLTGSLYDGTPIEGTDCTRLVGNVPKWLAARGSDISGDGVVNILDFAILADNWLQSSTVDD